MATHLVKLSNGNLVALIEEKDALSIAWVSLPPMRALEFETGDEVDDSNMEAYICKINQDGVQVYPNSGDATHILTTDLGV